MIEDLLCEVYGTDSGKKLFDLLSKKFNYVENIENTIILLETEDNRQKMIEFLQSGDRTVDEIHYFIVNITK